MNNEQYLWFGGDRFILANEMKSLLFDFFPSTWAEKWRQKYIAIRAFTSSKCAACAA